MSNLPSAMQLVWGMGHFVNEVLRQLFLFVSAKITLERVICYYSCVPCIVVVLFTLYTDDQLISCFRYDNGQGK